METVMASVYAANTQPICRAPPRSATIEGRAVATMVASMADSRVTTTSATKSRRRRTAGREDEVTAILGSDLDAARCADAASRRDRRVRPRRSDPDVVPTLADPTGLRWFPT